MARPHLVDLGLYAALIGAVFGIAWYQSAAEDDLPVRTEVPWPRIVVEGLSVPAAAGRLAFAARRATPRSAGAVLTLGGWREGLDLTGVNVELAPDCLLRGARGHYVGERLTLHDEVCVDRDGRRWLDADRVEIVDDRIRFYGLVVIHATAGPSTAMDLELTRAELLERLR